MSGHRPWREIKQKRPHAPERERRRAEMREAYDTVRPFVELTEAAGEEGVSANELTRALGEMDNPGDGALLGNLAEAVERLGGRLEVRLVFPDVPEDEVIDLCLQARSESGLGGQ